jgi:hypothetical protein
MVFPSEVSSDTYKFEIANMSESFQARLSIFGSMVLRRKAFPPTKNQFRIFFYYLSIEKGLVI